MSQTKRFRRAAIAAGAAVALGTGLFAGLGPAPGGASSHREAPLISADPTADQTDVYLFVDPNDPSKVVLIQSVIPFEEPAGGPNFYAFDPNARYEFKISNDDDAGAEITYRMTFDNHYRNPNTFLYNTGPVTSLNDADLNFYQTWDLFRISTGKKAKHVANGTVAPSNVGAASMPNYAALSDAAVTSFGDSQAWAGQSDDAFFLDLRVFDLLYGADFSEAGDDTLAGFNVNSIALRVPIDKITGPAGPVVGMWATVSRPKTKVLNPNGSERSFGPYIQVSRLGMPLVNEVVIPLKDKDYWNRSKPAGDVANFGGYITEPELPTLIEAVYGIEAPATPRNDLVAVFATGVTDLNVCCGAGEMFRLNTSIPPCEPGDCDTYSALGVIGGDLAGYPNGRRLADDTIDISLQVVEGELVGAPNDLGDGVGENDVAFRDAFPFLALPHSGSDAAPHPAGQI